MSDLTNPVAQTACKTERSGVDTTAERERDLLVREAALMGELVADNPDVCGPRAITRDRRVFLGAVGRPDLADAQIPRHTVRSEHDRQSERESSDHHDARSEVRERR